MHADQPPDLARRIVEELAGTMPPTTDLADITDDQLAAVGLLAIQRRRDDKDVIGKIAAEYHQNRKKPWREIADLLAVESHVTLYRWAKPFLGA
jgi:hypothetical protein